MNRLVILGLLTLGFLTFVMVCSAEQPADLIEVERFLVNDTTDQHEYFQYYSCGHFSRDLSRNASNINLTMGSVLLGNHPVFRGSRNHVMNYVYVDDMIWFIDPQTDSILTPHDITFEYYRLYPDGTQVPSFWKCNFAHTGTIEELQNLMSFKLNTEVLEWY